MVKQNMITLVIIVSLILFVSSLMNAQQSNIFFQESFDSNPFLNNKWVKSMDEKYRDQPVQWVASSFSAPGFENDKGLLLSEEMKYYGVSSKFQPFDLSNKANKELVIQYELKLEDTLSCGGAYIKLLRTSDTSKDIDLSKVNNDSPYTIMFGPDKCGGDAKLHFIVQYQNLVSKLWEEKHFNNTDIVIRDDKKTHLYTLVIYADTNDFEIFVDKKSTKLGNLLTHMIPSIVPSKDIDDPNDTKPVNWVDQAKIEDKTATKPDDWDEDAPQLIEDPNAEKPSAWLDDEPLEIPDPSHQKPEDWDDQEDGVWEAPTILNPKCEAAGCGVWTKPKIKNPAYKGKWRRPLIDNPEYKGPWSPRKIPNPNYFEVTNPARQLSSIVALAIEVWTTNKGIYFDNFFLSHSLKEAFQYAKNTFDLKEKSETEKEKKERDLHTNKESTWSMDKVKTVALGFIQFLSSEGNRLILQIQSFLNRNATNKAIAGAIVALVLSIIYMFIPTAASRAAEKSASRKNSPRPGSASPSPRGSRASDTSKNTTDENNNKSDE